MVWYVAAPVWSAKLGSSDNYNRAKTLGANQGKIRAVDDGTGRSSAAFPAVTRRTEDGIYHRATLWIAVSLRAVGRRIQSKKVSRLAPPRSHPVNDDIDLRGGQHSSGALRKGRHCGFWNSVRSYARHRSVVRYREVKRVAQSDCSSTPAILAMTPSTVFSVKEIEIHDLGGRDN